MKSFLLLAVTSFAVTVQAGVLPGVIGPFKQDSAAPLPVQTDRALWDENGLQDSEQGVYSSKGQHLQAEAWRLADATSAMAAFEYLRPADARPAPLFDQLTSKSALLPNGALLAVGNYLLRFQGPVPDADSVANMVRSMPRYDTAPLPTFMGYLPGHQLPNSERYIGGPVALKQFFPGIQPSEAAFHLGAEGAVAQYDGGLTLGLFSYPTPAIARDRAVDFQRIPNAVVKRSGPLVAVVLHPTDANAAELLLSKVRYQASVTTGEKPKSKKDNPANLLLNVFLLILILSVFCILSGVTFGLLRYVFRRRGTAREAEEMIALHLGER
jgi:hypothetical protein